MVAATTSPPGSRLGDLWGGAAAMLVALPAAIAFGVTIYSGIDAGLAAQGALAGILGAIALGLIAATVGGTSRLISAPCAPAAAVLAAFALDVAADGATGTTIVLLLTVVGLAAGVIQVAMGTARLGTLIKFVPYPVVSGYLSGVGLVIITSQVPRFLGLPKDVHFWQALAHPTAWHPYGMAVGTLTAAGMLLGPRLTRAVPAPIIGLAAGIAGYFALALVNPALLSLPGNPLLIGPLGGTGGGFVAALGDRWAAVVDFDPGQLDVIVMPALTLAVLLSIDTLKTCIVLDAMTRSHHDSNRELIGQGLGNIAATAIGGIPGAGTMGATLVNLSSGGATRLSGIAEGVFALLAFVALAPLIAWIPVAALSGILIVIGVRMIDWDTLHLVRTRDTALDFAIIAAVVTCALAISLIAAAAAGVVLAILLFLREQVGGQVVRRQVSLDQISSSRVRSREEREVLLRDGAQAAVVELQGSLFFGTANQLQLALEPALRNHTTLILDMRRVQTVDVTAGHVLDQIKQLAAESRATLIFSRMPRNLPTGRDIERYFGALGLVKPGGPIKVFDELDDALEWVETRLIEAARLDMDADPLLALPDIEPFKGRKPDTIADLEACLEARHVAAGDKIIAVGETGDELFLIRRGLVRIELPLGGGRTLRLSTFGRGVFFGEMAFLDGEPRSADAVAATDTDLFVLSRKRFDALAEHHRHTARDLMEALASALAARLRQTSAELKALDS